MEVQKLERGRLIDHVQIVVRDLAASRRFYGALMDVLGVPVVDAAEDFFWADELVVSTPGSEAAEGRLTGRIHLAFQAPDRATVEAAYRAGLAAGSSDNGPPGERTRYHPGYYAGFLLDPDGNNVEIVHHGPAKRSAPSVTISWEA